MEKGVFTDRELTYVEEHLRILSGFYGLLRPFDGVTPYRLEMQAKLQICEAKDLYGFWGNAIADSLFGESHCILNLASREYSRSVSPYLPGGASLIPCVFAERKGGKLIEKGTMCKMARGEMVRYMAENQIEDPEQIKAVDRLDFRFDQTRSHDNVFVFLRDTAKHE